MRVIERVFQKLSLAFGNQLNSKWAGMDMDMVYGEWANDLGMFSLGAIQHGIEVAKREQHPPSLGEFMAACTTFKPANVLKLEHRATPEQMAANRQKIQAIAEMLGRRKGATLQ